MSRTLLEVYEGLRRSRPDAARKFKEETRGVIVVDIQNVANYFWAESPQDEWSLYDDFPNVAPPWPRFWMEWSQPTSVRVGEQVKNYGSGNRFGSLIVAAPRAEGWAAGITTFAPAQPDPFMAISFLLIDSLGRIVPRPDPEGKPRAFFAAYTKRLGSAKVAEAFVHSWCLCPIALALSFCHCKNVLLEERPLRRAVRRRLEHVDLPQSSFFTLNIMPMRRVLAESGASGLKQALHICRGHFKDYRDGGGLFGRHHGIFWWDMQARGNARLGERRKDYSISPAEKAAI